jgi:hypothetical protein
VALCKNLRTGGSVSWGPQTRRTADPSYFKTISRTSSLHERTGGSVSWGALKFEELPILVISKPFKEPVVL